MRLPKKLKIGGKKYRVTEHRSELDTDSDGKQPLLGQVNHSLGLIRVCVQTEGKPIPADRIMDTLLHECLHAIFDANDSLRSLLRPGREESFVDTMASELAQLLLDNPELTTIIQGAER